MDIFVSLNYGGEWERIDGTWKWSIDDMKHWKEITVDRNISLNEFIDKVCEEIDIDRSVNEVVITRCTSTPVVLPKPILHNDNWRTVMTIHNNTNEMELFVTYTPCAPQSPICADKLPIRRTEGDTSQYGEQTIQATMNQSVSVWDNIVICDEGGGYYDGAAGGSIYHDGVGGSGVGADNVDGGGDGGGSLDNVDGGSDSGDNDGNDDIGGNDDNGGDGNINPIGNDVSVGLFTLCDRDVGGRPDGSNLVVGQTFKNKEEFNYVVGRVALKGKFEFVVQTSDKKRKVVKCVQKECKWRISASKRKTSEEFVIRTYKNIHTCSLESISGLHKQASSRLIGHRVQDQFLNARKPLTPAAVKQFMRTEENVSISYGKAWRGKHKALDIVRGTFEENFNKLPSYCYILEQTNPGTRTRILTDENNKFRYFFMAIGASIQGFRFMRDVIIIDASFMTNKYKGTLLIASATDSEHHSYPLAWGVGDTEDTNCWTWFLHCLQELIPDRHDLVFVSDRGQPIINAVSTVYPLAEHGHCYWHITQNIRKSYKVKGLVGLFHMAACSYNIQDFDRHFSELRIKSAECAKWLEETITFEKWARVHHRVNRYEVMTSNSVEVLNSMMKVAKDYPICALIEFVVDKMGEWFYNRREDVMRFQGNKLTPKREEQLRARFEKAQGWVTTQLSRSIFKVQSSEWSGVVDLQGKTCACGVFQIDMIPCEHALAAACMKEPKYAGTYFYKLTSPYFSQEYMLHAYIATIYPIPSEDQWLNIPEQVKNVIVLPPQAKRKRGRPRMDRLMSRIETLSKKTYRCRKCHGEGHNAQTCPVRHGEQTQ